MKKLSTGLEAIVDLVASAEAVKEALEDMRERTTDDEWEQICSNPHVDALLSACMELEFRIQ